MAQPLHECRIHCSGTPCACGVVRENPGVSIPIKDKARILAEEYAKRETWEVTGMTYREMTIEEYAVGKGVA